MKSSLSATRFVKNNKRKVGVIVASLSIALAGLYIIAYFLNSVVSTYEVAILDRNENVVYWLPSSDSVLMNDCENCSELAEKISNIDCVNDAIYTQLLNQNIIGPLGNVNFSQPIFDNPEMIPMYLDAIEATLVDGRMPANPGEIIMSVDAMRTDGRKIGDYHFEEFFGKGFQIVGTIDYNGYGFTGLTNGYMNSGWGIVIIVDDIKDMKSVLKDNGILIADDSEVGDYNACLKFLEEGVVGIAEPANDGIFIGLTALIAFSVLIVFISFIRERQTEWCLYRSIGYSKMDIFQMVLKELLIIFAIGIVIGAVIGGIGTAALNDVYINSLGYKGHLWLPDTFPKMLALLAVVLGVTQIPILYTIHNVGTIDKVED